MDYAKKALEEHEKHQGKLGVASAMPLENIDDLSVAYTPGVAEVCKVIAEEPGKAWTHTLQGRTVAVVTDGSAVLGLGDLGPAASLPVMEGKAALFKRFAGVDAFPIALDTYDVDEIVETVVRLAPTFGGINLEDISAPRCFEIEEKLMEQLDIPVMHDDQHGTAIVVLAGFLNALKVIGKSVENLKVVISGAGAAGLATAYMLRAAGVRDIVVLDSRGIIVSGRENLNPYKEAIASYNVRGIEGGLGEAVRGADAFIGVSAPNILSGEMVQSMTEGPIIFALSNPVPEIDPVLARASGAAIVATGRSDLPNQVNNVLAFPGIFKGALEVRAKKISMEMKLAAAHAIADLVPDPSADEVIPSPFTPNLGSIVAEAVKKAHNSGKN